jgi:heavy metal sensor kinase
MHLSRLLRLRHTLAFRLTLWYAAIFTILSFAAFAMFYFLMTSVVRSHIDQDLLNEISEYSSLLSLKGIDALETALVLEAESEGIDKVFFRVLAPNGEKIVSSNMSCWTNTGIGRTALKRLANGANHVFETLAVPARRHKVRILYGIIGPGKIIQIGQSLKAYERLMESFREIFGATMSIILVFSGLTGWFMARRALLGVAEVTRTAMDISSGAFDRRVCVKARGDEITRLASTFNSMLDQIHALITGMREMTDSIAHDLRSPITRIRGVAEMTLTSGKSIDEYETMAANTIEECDHLLEMINTMLDISEAEAGATKLAMEKTDIAKVVRDACELFQPTAEDKGVTINSQAPARCYVSGDIQKLQRMVANLLDNAVKYTPSEGSVTVSINGDEEQIAVSFNDTGIGISEHDLPHIFKRFYRCDKSRSQAGIGLGLSLAMAIARAHGGNIIANSNLGKGSTFTVTLPRMPPLHLH